MVTYEMMQQALSSETHFNVLEDLIEFTGLSEEEVIDRVLRKPRSKEPPSARGWFDEEYDFYKPRTEAELRWFYMANQSYLFSNSRKSTWMPVMQLKESDAPILDYGAGIGTNVLYLMNQKIEAWYYELNHLQSSFFLYRMMKRRLKANVLFPMIEKPLSSFGTVILQDVLEHIPNYKPILIGLIQSLRVDGKLIEESPFAKVKYFEKRKLHLQDRVGLDKVMESEGMVLEKTVFEKVHIWRKRG